MTGTYKQKREAHSSLASLIRRLRIAHGVETSNSELHADTIYHTLHIRYAYGADTP